MTEAPNRLVGTTPWLPWPLSAWPWWTRPVRAERLASLRIAIAFFLLLDILSTYGWRLHDFFGPDSLGSPELFTWRAESPRLNWSLLRGVGDPAVMALGLALLIGSTLWLLGNFISGLIRPTSWRPQRSLLVWSLTGALYTTGVWARLVAANESSTLAWIVPAILTGIVAVFLLLDALRRRGDLAEPRLNRALFAAALLMALLVALGAALSEAESFDAENWWVRALGPWQNDVGLLRLALALWLVSTFLLLLGLATPLAAFGTWALALSFANANSYIDNAGDQIRVIILFYLMLCPCGAVWSLDQRLARRGPEVVWTPPWPLRLLFVQLVLIYFCNGIYKLGGSEWTDGNSLFYVMGDLTLTRFSLADLPFTVQMMQCLTWSVLVWEVSFPLLVLWRPTRILALLFGVGFHIGIYASMELGFFAPYALCLYVPLLPWERLKWAALRDSPEPGRSRTAQVKMIEKEMAKRST